MLGIDGVVVAFGIRLGHANPKEVALVECLPSAQAWVQSPALQKPGIVVHTCFLEERARGLVEFQGHPQLHGEFAIILVPHETPKIFPHAHQADRM